MDVFELNLSWKEAMSPDTDIVSGQVKFSEDFSNQIAFD